LQSGAALYQLTTVLFTLLFAQIHLYAQQDNALKSDSLQIAVDSLPPGTLRTGKGSLDKEVIYSARDSMRFDLGGKRIYLYGAADVKYGNIRLKADFITINWETNLINARGTPDSTGKLKGKPVFSQDGQEFESEEMDYNFKTRKGKIRDIYTKQGDGFLLGEQVRKGGGDDFYVRNGKYTTCDLPDHPHFYINAGKIKVIPNDKIVTGPANLVIEDIPTPLAVPFGLFPNSTKRKSGIVFPTYGESPALGFYLKDGGYYFGINDYFDAILQGTIYSRGSWGLNTGSSYNVRYKYNGRFSLGYSKILQGDPDLLGSRVNKDFFIRWNHSQDPKANPNSRFSANVQAGSSNYNYLNSLNPATIVTNTFQSAVSYSRNFGNSPWSMVLSAGHSQNTATRVITVSAPELQVNRNRSYPFKRKEAIGKERWYERIGYTYTLQSRNTISLPDSLYGRPGWERKFNNGVQHLLPINTSFQLFKFITVSPSVNTSWRWYFSKLHKSMGNNMEVITDTLPGFFSNFEYNANISASTRVFSFLKLGKSTIRNVMSPQVSFRYQPDFSSLEYGYFGSGGSLSSYSPFQGGIYGSPSVGRQGTVGFALNNNLEGKFRSKRDSSGFRKLVLLEAFNIATGYNLAADSLNWQQLSVAGRTKLLKKLDFVYAGTYDFYALDPLTRNRINTSELQMNGRLMRMVNTRFAFTTVLASSGKKEKQSKKGTPEQLKDINSNPEHYVDFSIPWELSANYNITITNTGKEVVNSQVLNLTGRINLTSKWRFEFSSGYDFRLKDFSFSTVDIYRDLHCWEMHFNWIPFGFRRSFNFTINVKSSVLQDLKLNRRRQWFDLQGQ